jgi:hypothetical protein
MDQQTNDAALRYVINALDTTIRDVAERRVHDAWAVQAAVRQMLEDHKAGRSTVSGCTGQARRVRATFGPLPNGYTDDDLLEAKR